CGLEFSCTNVMSPRLIGPAWSYEHTLAPRAGRFWATTWAALRPWALCRDLSVEHVVRGGRLLRFGACWLGLVHVATVMVVGGLVLVPRVRVALSGLPGVRGPGYG